MENIKELYQFKALAEIIKNPGFDMLMEEVGLMEDDPNLAIDYNTTHGNIYIAFCYDIALYVYEGDSKNVRIVFENSIDGGEYESAKELRENIEVDIYQENRDVMDKALNLMEKWEALQC